MKNHWFYIVFRAPRLWYFLHTKALPRSCSKVVVTRRKKQLQAAPSSPERPQDTPHEAPKRPQDVFKTTLRRLLLSLGAQKHYKTNGFSWFFIVRHNASKTHRRRPKPPQDAPRHAQDAPKTPPRSPKTHHDASKTAPRRLQDCPKMSPQTP